MGFWTLVNRTDSTHCPQGAYTVAEGDRQYINKINKNSMYVWGAKCYGQTEQSSENWKCKEHSGQGQPHWEADSWTKTWRVWGNFSLLYLQRALESEETQVLRHGFLWCVHILWKAREPVWLKQNEPAWKQWRYSWDLVGHGEEFGFYCEWNGKPPDLIIGMTWSEWCFGFLIIIF